ncbi:MAG TPA: hypothetical protein PKD19_01985 [Candidatus Saccharibacteria bacterium]|nr:hypothetical protein [Candidatus Saccharibacteria bacterium]
MGNATIGPPGGAGRLQLAAAAHGRGGQVPPVGAGHAVADGHHGADAAGCAVFADGLWPD